MHCKVANHPHGPWHSATYPFNLCGKFELLDQPEVSTTTARRLLRHNFPVCVTVDQPDASLGFDPLRMKEKLVVNEVLVGEFQCHV